MKTPHDISVSNQGTVFQFIPATVPGRDWLDANLATPDYARLGQTHVVEHRYAADIIDGAAAAGLNVSFH